MLRQYIPKKSKLEDQGTEIMFLGYEKKHTSGTYFMFNLHTKRIVLSLDIICLNKTYSDYVSTNKTIKTTSYIINDEDK